MKIKIIVEHEEIQSPDEAARFREATGDMVKDARSWGFKDIIIETKQVEKISR